MLDCSLSTPEHNPSGSPSHWFFLGLLPDLFLCSQEATAVRQRKGNLYIIICAIKCKKNGQPTVEKLMVTSHNHLNFIQQTLRLDCQFNVSEHDLIQGAHGKILVLLLKELISPCIQGLSFPGISRSIVPSWVLNRASHGISRASLSHCNIFVMIYILRLHQKNPCIRCSTWILTLILF